MFSHCVAYGCGKTEADGVTLFKFPKNQDEFHKWEKQVQRARSDWVATPDSFLCNEHFGSEYFEPKHPAGVLKLRPGAAPTVFVRPHCSSCRGTGCKNCLHTIQHRNLTTETTKRGINGDTNFVALIEFNEQGSSREKAGKKTNRQAVCEMCRKTGNFDDFISRSKRFCSIFCSRSYSSNSKKISILTRLQGRQPSKKATVTHKIDKPSADPPVVDVFNWGAYLDGEASLAASVSCFQHAPLCKEWSEITVGMKVEVLNTNALHPNKVYWIATVLQLAGYKALLRYEGFEHDSSKDFWCSLVSGEMHPIGWSATTNKMLVPPQDVKNIPDWNDYLMKKLLGTNTLPADLNMKLAESMKTSFRVGMRVEVVDPKYLSRTRLATIDSIVGGRLHLVFIDQSDATPNGPADFWCHMFSPLVHPIGWSKNVGHAMKALGNTTADGTAGFGGNSDSYADQFKKHRFTYMGYVYFEEGMKLEAIDPLNLGKICVATIRKVLSEGYVMVGIDGATNTSQYFCHHASSHGILPINFCKRNNIPLKVPLGWDSQTFCWEEYLEETGSKAVPTHVFTSDYPGHGFSPNMKLEAVDLMEPRLVCVATVKRCVGRLLLIHFDDWADDFDQWIDYQSPDIYPIGWCELVGYKLQPPPLLIPYTDKTMARKKKTKPFVYRRKKRRNRNKTPPRQPEIIPEKNPSQVIAPPEIHLIQPKTEPQEEEIFAVQVKVEEIEMETPIEPADNQKQVLLSQIKQEETEQQISPDPQQLPTQSFWENSAH